MTAFAVKPQITPLLTQLFHLLYGNLSIHVYVFLFTVWPTHHKWIFKPDSIILDDTLRQILETDRPIQISSIGRRI